MDFNNQQIKVAKLLDIVSSIYKNYFLCDEIFREQFKNGYKALFCFLENYAYERQGAAPAYSKIAVKCITRRYQDGRAWSVPTKDDAERLWEDYKDIAKKDFNLLDKETKKIKVNEINNPMNKDGGVIEKEALNNISNIAVHVRDLVDAGDTAQAYDFINGIRGIGEKIASFYLRDIVYLTGLDEAKIPDLFLLQPIDTWLEQALEILFHSDVPDSLEKKQKLIVNLCQKAKVSSISFNQGAWVLGSQIAGEFETFKSALSSCNGVRSVIKKHIDEKEGYLSEVKEAHKALESLKGF